MTGVEILYSETIYNTFLPKAFFAIGIVLMFAFLIAGVFCIANDTIVGAVICWVLMFCSLAVAILGDAENKNSVHHIEYKVTIDESVSMTEFMDKYEIIDQEGKIYTVKEK